MRTSSFSTRALAVDQQVLAWRTRVGHAVDVPPTKAQLTDGFGANIDLFVVGESVFSDVRTDAMVLERPVARVSTDARRDFAFHLFLEGETGDVTGMSKKRSAPGSVPGIVAFDMNQPFRVERPACRVLTLFVPRPAVDAGMPDSDSLHGRIVQFDAPLARVALDHFVATRRSLPTLAPEEAANALKLGGQLLLAAFRQDSSLTGAGRAALQAAVHERDAPAPFPHGGGREERDRAGSATSAATKAAAPWLAPRQLTMKQRRRYATDSINDAEAGPISPPAASP